MDRKLQTAPIGLLGALNMKVGGENPDLFGGRVTPSVDVLDNYLLDKEAVQGASVALAIGATNGVVPLAAPAGFIWRVLATSAILVVNAADVAINANVSIEVLPAGSPAACQVSNQPFVGLQLTQRHHGWYADRALLLPPGWSMQARVNLTAALTVAGTLVVEVYRQQIEI